MSLLSNAFYFFFSSRRRHTRSYGDWSSDVCSSDLVKRLLHLHPRSKCRRRFTRHHHLRTRPAAVLVETGSQSSISPTLTGHSVLVVGAFRVSHDSPGGGVRGRT